MPYKDPTGQKEYSTKRLEDLKRHAMDSITSGEIIDHHKWDVWCNIIKRGAKKYPYSEDLTNEKMFVSMANNCFYCGDIATTIDRIDSTLTHTPENCVGCCFGCNISKGASDSSTFIRKAYYNARGGYIDENTDIWFENKTKPKMSDYKKRANKKGVSFDLTKEEWDILIKGVCEYCKRTPPKWFGIDRVKPEDGYVIGNVVSCCFDCNNDKHVADIKTTRKRNERIANRVDNGVLVITDCEKTTLHKGTQNTSKKVCVYGKVYTSHQEASRALGKSKSYVGMCIRDGRYSDDIFEVEK